VYCILSIQHYKVYCCKNTVFANISIIRVLLLYLNDWSGTDPSPPKREKRPRAPIVKKERKQREPPVRRSRRGSMKEVITEEPEPVKETVFPIVIDWKCYQLYVKLGRLIPVLCSSVICSFTIYDPDQTVFFSVADSGTGSRNATRTGIRNRIGTKRRSNHLQGT